MDMELLHVKAFVIAAKHLNFTRVADQMFISQPSISKYISALEAELGEALFFRASRSVKLTDFGEAFLPCAQAMLEKEQEALDFLQSYKHIDTPSLVIGINSSISDGSNAALFNALISSVGELKQIHPEVFVKIRFFPSEEMPILINTGKIDFGIAPMDQLSFKRVLGDISQYHLLRTVDHYLALPPHLQAKGNLEEISRNLDTLFFVSEPIPKNIVDSFLNLYRITPRLRTVTLPAELIMRIISDEGAGIIEGHMLSFTNLLNIPTIPLKDVGIESGLYAYWFSPQKTNIALNPYIEPFVAYLQAWLRVEDVRASHLLRADGSFIRRP